MDFLDFVFLAAGFTAGWFVHSEYLKRKARITVPPSVKAGPIGEDPK